MRIGKTCVITGGTSGIGESAAIALADRGAELALVCRSEARGQATKEKIESRVGRSCVRLFQADFERLAEVRRVAREIRDELETIDVLLNNAGVAMLSRSETPDGFETTFAVNVASDAHRFGRLDLEDLQSTRRYSAMRVYGGSKLANILFTRELARRLEGRGIGIWSLHPGAVATRLGANNGGIAKLVLPLLALFFRTPEQGAQTSIHLCSEPEIDAPNGSYFVDSKVRKPSAKARDDEMARRLWEESERLVGLMEEERIPPRRGSAT